MTNRNVSYEPKRSLMCGRNPSTGDVIAVALDSQGRVISTAGGGAFQTLTYATTTVWDVDSGVNALVVLTGNTTFAKPTNISDGDCLILQVSNDGSSGHTIAFASGYLFPLGNAPIKSNPASSVDIMGFKVVGTDVVFQGIQYNVQ